MNCLAPVRCSFSANSFQASPSNQVYLPGSILWLYFCWGWQKYLLRFYQSNWSINEHMINRLVHPGQWLIGGKLELLPLISSALFSLITLEGYIFSGYDSMTSSSMSSSVQSQNESISTFVTSSTQQSLVEDTNSNAELSTPHYLSIATSTIQTPERKTPMKFTFQSNSSPLNEALGFTLLIIRNLIDSFQFISGSLLPPPTTGIIGVNSGISSIRKIAYLHQLPMATLTATTEQNAEVDFFNFQYQDQAGEESARTELIQWADRWARVILESEEWKEAAYRTSLPNKELEKKKVGPDIRKWWFMVVHLYI